MTDETIKQPHKRVKREQRPKIKKNAIDGWLIIDKPEGMGSTDVVTRVKRCIHPEKIGHAGTLDPLATGVLPLALGQATKTVPFAMDSIKTYVFTVRWGERTDTDDSQGKVIATSETRPTQAQVDAILPRFLGLILQEPPIYSALKINGERAYDLARAGKEVILAPREVWIEELLQLGMPDADTSIFTCTCGKGTYVRALARDFGRLLGCQGHIVELRRTRVGSFHALNAIPLDKFEEMCLNASLDDVLATYLHPIQTALDDILALAVNGVDANRLRRGQSILLRGAGAPIEADQAYAHENGQLLALGVVEDGTFVPTRVFT